MKKTIPTPGLFLFFLMFFASCIAGVFFQIFWPIGSLCVLMVIMLLIEAWNADNFMNEIERKKWEKISKLKERQEQLKKDRERH